MGRQYAVYTGWQTVSAAQDLLEITAATGKPFFVNAIAISQSSDAGDSEAEMLQVTLKRGEGMTSGSGGGSATTTKWVSDADPGKSLAALRNNTTQGSAGSGTLTDIWAEAFNVQAGYFFAPSSHSRPYFSGADGSEEAFVLAVSVPADALTMNAVVIIEEEG